MSLSQFAADLYDVMMDRGTRVYRDPAEFFALTFPTYNLRDLAKDVVHRLSGYQDAFWALIGLALLGALLAFVLLRGTKIELPEAEAAPAS